MSRFFDGKTKNGRKVTCFPPSVTMPLLWEKEAVGATESASWTEVSRCATDGYVAFIVPSAGYIEDTPKCYCGEILQGHIIHCDSCNAEACSTCSVRHQPKPGHRACICADEWTTYRLQSELTEYWATGGHYSLLIVDKQSKECLYFDSITHHNERVTQRLATRCNSKLLQLDNVAFEKWNWIEIDTTKQQQFAQSEDCGPATWVFLHQFLDAQFPSSLDDMHMLIDMAQYRKVLHTVIQSTNGNQYQYVANIYKILNSLDYRRRRKACESPLASSISSSEHSADVSEESNSLHDNGTR